MRSALIAGLLLVSLAAAGQGMLFRDPHESGTFARFLDPRPAPGAGLLPKPRFVHSQLEYAGEVRYLPPDPAAKLKAWLARAPMSNPDWHAYQREFRFRERGRDVWLVVREAGDLTRALKRGDRVEAFGFFAGHLGEWPLVIVTDLAREGQHRMQGSVITEASYVVNEEARQAALAVERIRECLAQYRARHPAVGFPRTLAELGPAGAGCIDAGIASGAVHRHRIAYGTGARDAAGRAHFYLVCARPERYWLDSLTVAGADEIGTFGGGEEGGPLDACSAPSRDGFRAVKNCLVAYAAGDSRGEYPTDLLALGAAGSGCLTRGRGEVSPTGRYYSRDDAVVAYTAGPGPRRMSFDLRRDQRVARQYMEFLMDETGARYAGLSRFGGASRASEPEDAFVDKWKQREREYFGRQPALVQGCETGRAQDCYEAAHRLYATEEQAKAKELWTRACGAGHAESCLFDTAVHDAYYARWRARCEAREDFACRVVEGFRGPSIFSQSLTLRRECEIDMPDSCRALREDAAKLQAGEPVLRVASRVPPKVFSRPPR